MPTRPLDLTPSSARAQTGGATHRKTLETEPAVRDIWSTALSATTEWEATLPILQTRPAELPEDVSREMNLSPNCLKAPLSD